MSQQKQDKFQMPAWTEQLDGLMEGGEDLEQGRVTVQFRDGSEPLSVSRRDFLRVAGAAAAATGLSACRVEPDYIAPYVDRPEEIYHGVPNTYSSICKACPAQCGIELTVREGRVSKLEGDENHPLSKGALCSRGQASTLDAYSADRLKGPRKGGAGGGKVEALGGSPSRPGTETTWEELDKAVIGAMGGKVRLLTGTMNGPGQKALLKDFISGLKDGKHVTWEPLANTAAAAAHKSAYGEAFAPFYRFDRASAIVSFGSEFLDAEAHSTIYTRQFADTRDPDKGDAMSHLTVFEGRMTLTGGAADTRHRVRTSDLLYVALAVAHELIVAGGVGGPLASDPSVKATLAGYAADKTAAGLGLDPKAIKDAAAQLKAAGKKGLAVATRATVGAETARLEAVVALINEALGAVGTTVEHTRVFAETAPFSEVDALIKELAGGTVDLLIISGLNPVYDMPASVKFADAMGKAKTVVVIDSFATETAAAATWMAARTHFLESWGDAEGLTGQYSIQQPGMTSVFPSVRSTEDCLITWAAGAGNKAFAGAVAANAGFKDKLRRPAPGPWYQYLKAHWTGPILKATGSPVGAEAFWEAVVRKDVYTMPGSARQVRRFNTAALKAIAGPRPDKPAGKIEVELYAKNTMGDGRQASNGLLLEVPDTISKVSWDNYACVSPARFKAMNLTALGDLVKVTVNGTTLDVPAMMIPGMHDDVVAVAIGYGHTHAGIVGSGIGVNVFPMAGASAQGPVYTGLEATVDKGAGNHELGMPRGAEHVLDNHTRHIVPTATLAEYKKSKGAGVHNDNHPQFWGDHKYPKLKWSMTIDLSRCTGCAACVTACAVENNTPVVGKQGVLEGRLMQWMRLDRYYALPTKENGDYTQELLDETPMIKAAEYLENPQFLLEPMLCQHCDNAPCETVCPVAATVHSDDGLNEQVYNRCVGTRYCANNCPYKMRRFNWYNYTTDRSEDFVADVFPEVKELANLNAKWPSALRFNPEVTVRARGVMEKCTFCVQRLRRSTVVARKLGIANIEEPQTACQQTCPAEAIVFGNVSDEKSPVHKTFNSERAMSVLSHVGTKPAVRYLTRVRRSKQDNA